MVRVKKLVALAVVLLLLLALAVARGTKVDVHCGGPAVTTPWLIRGLDGAESFGEQVRKLADGDVPGPLEVARFVRDVGRAVRLLWDTSAAEAQGRKQPRQAEGLRRDTRRNTEAALIGCCVEWSKRVNPDPGTPGPEADDDGNAQPWDPRMASIADNGVQVDCGAVTCEAPGTPRVAPAAQRARFTREQREIAAVAVEEVRTSGIPQRWQKRAVVVALAAGFQESGVRNLPYGHSSSVGWLQLIQAHGTHAQRMDPRFSVRWFYRELQSPIVKWRMGKPWTKLSVNDAAQGAQGSGFPNAYGQWRDDAERLLADVGGMPRLPAEPEACVPNPEGAQAIGRAAPARWNFGGQATVEQAVAFMRRQDQQNTGGWQNRCLAAVRQAYGHPYSHPVNGHFYAIDVWRVMPPRYKVPGRVAPPRGALVFWDTGRVEGHIAISNGDGRVWTTDPPGRKGQVGLVDLSAIDRWGTRLGYGAPVFPGWTKTGVQA